MKSILSCRSLMIVGLLATCSAGVIYADDYDDDIYFNRKKKPEVSVKTDNARKTSGTGRITQTSGLQQSSAYIADFDEMDVDSYNRRGQYYATPIDTIGIGIEQGDDFVYTQQIQKFYNPKIVVSNAYQLEDILENSYGNVEVVYDFSGAPSFTPVYVSPYVWNSPYANFWYDSFWASPSWSLTFAPSWGWGPSWSFNWGPSWGWGPSWTWRPAWAWGPSYGWGWGPSLGPVWGWGHHPVYRPSNSRPHTNYRPNGNKATAPNAGWSTSTRPSYGGSGGAVVNGGGGRRPGVNAGSSTSRPAAVKPGSTTAPGAIYRGNRGQSNTATLNKGVTTSAGRPASAVQNSSAGSASGSQSSRPGRYTINTGSQTHSSGASAGSHSTGTGSGSSNSGRYNSGSSTSGSSNSGGRYNSGASRSGSSGSRSSGSSSAGGSRGARGGRR